MDDSFRRPGSIPFKWEICPGTPKPLKHTRTASASTFKVSPKLNPPPFMASPSPSPSHPPRTAARSASVSPSRRHGHRYFRRANANASGEVSEAETASFRCFPIPNLRRKDDKKGGFRSDEPTMRRSTSSSSSSFSVSSRKFAGAREEAEAATRWFF